MKPQSDALILQTGDTQSLPFWKDKSWKHYPFAYPGTEEHFTLPAAVGWHPGYESQSWDIEAYVKGKESGKTYTVVHIYSYNAMGKLFGFSCRVLNVADIAEKKRYVDRRYHFRPFPGIYKPPFDVTEGNLDITYHPRGNGVDRWYPRKDSSGNVLPFEFHLEAARNPRAPVQTKLSVDIEALKPPLLDGGMDYRGTLTMFGQPNTFAFCLSPRVKVRGTLEIAGKTEHIEGVGKVGLQWAPKQFGSSNKPIKRIKHQYLGGNLSNGWDFGLWRQYDTLRYNRLLPFSGIFALFEDNTMATTNNYTFEPISYYQNRTWPKEAGPIFRTAPKNSYVPNAVRLTVPEWDADLVIAHVLEDNTQAVFVEYFFGPVEITGKVRGKEVYGLGFLEGTKLYYQEHEFIEMIRNTLKNLPDQAFIGTRAAIQRKLNNDLEEILTAVQVGDKLRAKELLEADLSFISQNIKVEMTAAPAASLSDLCNDFISRL
jgi:predicted secreted hydrolase